MVDAHSFKGGVHDDRVAIAVDDGLRPLNRQSSLREYIQRLWKHRHFTIADAKARAFTTTDNYYLGKLWVILDPVLQILMFAFLFGFILNTSRGIENFLGYLTIGVIFFGFFTGGISSGTGLISSSKNLTTTFHFPQAAVVLGRWLRGLFTSTIPAVVAIFAAQVFQWGEPISWTLILVIPIYFIMQLFILGLIFFSARFTAFIPDNTKVLNVFKRAWFYISGVFFSIERFGGVPVIQEVMVLNPAFQFLDMIRNVVMYGTVPSVGNWVYVLGWACGFLFISFIYFWKAEARYARIQ